jgi:hypothetical protein
VTQYGDMVLALVTVPGGNKGTCPAHLTSVTMIGKGRICQVTAQFGQPVKMPRERDPNEKGEG